MCNILVYHDVPYTIANPPAALETADITKCSEFALFSSTYTEFRVTGCKINIIPSNWEAGNINIAYLGCTSFTFTNDN